MVRAFHAVVRCTQADGTALADGATVVIPHTGGMTDPLLPDITSDETDAGWGDRPESDSDADERILREIPPHHGD